MTAGRSGKIAQLPKGLSKALGLKPDLSDAGPDLAGMEYLTKHKKKAKGGRSKAKPDAKDPREVVLKAFTAFTEGKFKGAACKDEATKFFSADAVIDARGPQDASFFKKYSAGLDGVCEYFGKTATDYKLTNLTARIDTKADRVIQMWEYIPEYAGLKSTEQLQQFNIFRLDKSKTRIAGMDVLFDKPSVLDKLTPGASSEPTKSPQMQIVADLFSGFANKTLEGDACQPNAARFFTNKSTIDSRGPEEQEYFKVFGPGAPGVCDYWTGMYNILMHGLNASMYARGEDVVLLLDYRPEIPKIEMPDKHILQYYVVSFNKDNTKCQDVDVFFDNSFLFNAVAHPDESEEHDAKWAKYVKPIMDQEKAKTDAKIERMSKLAQSAELLGTAVASAAR